MKSEALVSERTDINLAKMSPDTGNPPPFPIVTKIPK